MRDPATSDRAQTVYLGGWDEGSVTSKCTRGHRKTQQRCTSRCRRWYWILPAPPGPDGKRRRQWSQAYTTKTQAEEALTEELRRRDQGIILNQEKITLREFSRRWLDHMARLGHDERTLERYQELLELHVPPTIGGLQLKAIQPLHLSDLYVRLLTSGRRDGKPGGLKPRTVGHVHRAIHRMLKQAVRWRLIALNPASDLELPTVADQPMVTLSIEQARTLLEANPATTLAVCADPAGGGHRRQAGGAAGLAMVGHRP